MLTKEQLLDRLRNDPMYRSALKMAKTDGERKKIIATAEGFLSTFFEAMSPIARGISSDPKQSSELLEAVKSGGRLVRESDGKDIVPDEPKKT